MELPVVKVDCGSCHACCEAGSYAPLDPAVDDVGSYRTQVTDGVLMLAKKRDHSCHYLGERGCAIHDRRPAACKRFSCILAVFHGHSVSDTVRHAGRKRIRKVGAA